MIRYKMLARDVDSSPIEYRTWVVDGYPDYTGQYYTGPKGGDNPFVDTVAYIVTDGYVVDFNLPDPESWNTTYCQLPENVESSQLTIIDGYIYMFGGKITDKIYRAHEGRPTDWVDTGAKLPTPLYGSHLSIIDGYIYLFGGNNGLATDTIYSAPVSDPLTWTNHGSLLPRKLYYSQCIVTANDGYICLFGGYTYNNPTGLMFYAKTSDPLMWYTHQQLILYPLYGSSAAIINNNIYLYGGMESDSIFSPRKTILYANIDELFADQSICAWHNATQTLPYGYSFGQFITIGSGGYIFAADSEESFTKIFYCSLSDPLTWTQLTTEIPYTLYQSQLAIINDRIFFFGGNGNSLILACDPLLYYIYSAPEVLAYGDITRTQYQAATNKEDLSLILGFPYWKTNYVSNL